MIPAKLPYNETERLDVLNSLKILDTVAEDDYDNLTELASFICGTPISLISLIDKDRQWFKSKKGLTACETSRDISFCAHAILEPLDILEVPDARHDIRFIDNPLIKLETPVIFYAGIPLKTEQGIPLGTLCVIDNKPNSLTREQKNALKKLGKQVERLLLLRTKNNELTITKESLKKHNGLLKEFAAVVSHDLKMPLANLILTSDIVKKKYSNVMDDKGKEYLDYLKKSSRSMSDYITKILDHYECISYDIDDTQQFGINDLLEDVIDLMNIKDNCEILTPEKNIDIICNNTALQQIFMNLIGNSLKYGDKEKTIVEIEASSSDSFYKFKIRDNGRGIEKEKLETIFGLFVTIGHFDNAGEKGHGIGLSTVQNLVESLGGKITVSSELGIFSEFIFTIAKRISF
ncbi:GAF domain-containing sensor histidine kinase [Formosa sp. PL04]|uniref:sensor histidine kinase n=1 Tax=Formosa sp. PL04 TaxID=3081755 RepID=UPI00298138D6|nr:GAF domain-containing sensor histidine kinase [Formosa sp. PL04]MDW5290247.1 GAF domain-containing sensor histidine kinase [Formosa sp. PL04]